MKVTEKKSAFWEAAQRNLALKRKTEKIKPLDSYENIPLSFGQEKLWLVEKLQNKNTIHNININFRFQGLLNVEILEKTIQAIVNRHHILSSYFVIKDKQPQQAYDKNFSFNLPIIDLRKFPESQREKKRQKLYKIIIINLLIYHKHHYLIRSYYN